MKNIKFTYICLIVSLLVLLILPSCDTGINDIPDKFGTKIFAFEAVDIKHEGTNEAEPKETLETELEAEVESASGTIAGEEYSLVYIETPDGEIIDLGNGETMVIALDGTEETDYVIVVEEERDYYSLTMFGSPDDIKRVISSIRSGYNDFVYESMKTYRAEYGYHAGLSEHDANVIAEGLVSMPLVLPKGDFEVDVFGITYYPKTDFLVISYYINSVKYTFRYEDSMYKSRYRVRDYGYVLTNLDGIQFRLFLENNGENWGIFDHPDMTDRFLEVIVSEENHDLGIFEFVYMP